MLSPQRILPAAFFFRVVHVHTPASRAQSRRARRHGHLAMTKFAAISLLTAPHDTLRARLGRAVKHPANPPSARTGRGRRA